MNVEQRALERALQGHRNANELQALRVLGFALGVSAVILSFTWGISLNPGDTPDTYVPTLSGVLVVPALLSFASPWLPGRAVRAVMWLLTVSACVLAVALLIDAVSGAAIDGNAIWPLSITAVATTASLVAGGLWVGVGVLLVTWVIMQGVRHVTVGLDFALLVNDAQAFLSSLVILVLVWAFIVAARELDRAVSAAMHAEAKRASASGRRAAGQHAQALVHDEVMSTLLLAATGRLRDAVAERAGVVVARIRALGRELVDAPVDRAAYLEHLTRLAQRVAPGTALVGAIPSGPPLDASVADAIDGAVEQALVNSVAHAGEVPRRIEVAGDADGVEISVIDEGRGFDPEAVAPDRLGITSSIIGRMHAVGGLAHVTSQPGRGTTVQLRWTAELEEPAADISVLHGTPVWVGRLTVAVFCAVQLVMALLIAMETGAYFAAGITLAGVLAGLGVLDWRSLQRTSLPRAVVCAVITIVLTLSAVLLDAGGNTLVASWSLTAGGFVLAALAVRGWPVVATIALGALVGFGIVVAAVEGFARGEAISAIGRPVIVGFVAIMTTVQLRRLGAQTGRVRAEEVATLRRVASVAAGRAELRARAETLEVVVGPTLERLRRGEWNEQLRSESSMLEGRLRDEYRGGRLARSPLAEAVARARARGIDVVLLDDAGDRCLDEAALDAIASWMCRHVDDLAHGRFTGRLLPANNERVASVVVGDHFETFAT